MAYREVMEYAVRWTDGFSWKADGVTFRRVTRHLDALRGVIVGLDPVLDRWKSLGEQGTELPVDAFAPAEGDRAVFTAALARALDDARFAPQPDDEETTQNLVERLRALHELFMTDITR